MHNNSDRKSMPRDAGILFAITLIAGLLLGFVYELTKEPIRIQKEKTIQKACGEVYADASVFKEARYVLSDNLQSELSDLHVKIGRVYCALSDSGVLLGYVLESTTTEGYAGNITIYMGVTLEGYLNGISILDISETPGLGMKADEILVPQFVNKQVSSFVYTKSGSLSDLEIDAISGATITTKAVTNAVNGGLLVAGELKEGEIYYE